MLLLKTLVKLVCCEQLAANPVTQSGDFSFVQRLLAQTFDKNFKFSPQKQDHCCIYKKSMPAQILHWWIAPKHIKSTFVFLTAIFCQINHLRISPGRVLILLVLNKSWEFQNCTNQPLNIKTAKPMITWTMYYNQCPRSKDVQLKQIIIMKVFSPQKQDHCSRRKVCWKCTTMY